MCTGQQLTQGDTAHVVMGWMRWWAVFILALGVRGEGEEDMVTSNQINMISGDAEKNTTFETLPTAQEWRNAPSCPLWGPMDSFYKEGIEKGQVGKLDKVKSLHHVFASCSRQRTFLHIFTCDEVDQGILYHLYSTLHSTQTTLIEKQIIIE